MKETGNGSVLFVWAPPAAANMNQKFLMLGPEPLGPSSDFLCHSAHITKDHHGPELKFGSTDYFWSEVLSYIVFHFNLSADQFEISSA